MSKKMMIFMGYFLLALGMTGCAVWKPVTQGHNSWKAEDFTADLPVGWVRGSAPDCLLILTKDGVYLQEITLSRTKTEKELTFSKKKITKDMLLQEIADITINEMTLNQAYKNFELMDNKPVRLGGLDAFRLVYTFRNDDFLRYKCVHYGFIYKKKYYEIQYLATVQHNFQNGEKDFERFIDSFIVRTVNPAIQNDH